MALCGFTCQHRAAPAAPVPADAGWAAAAASSAALPVASVGSSTARLVSVPRRNEGGCGPRASASVTVKSMACAKQGGGVCAERDAEKAWKTLKADITLASVVKTSRDTFFGWFYFSPGGYGTLLLKYIRLS